MSEFNRLGNELLQRLAEVKPHSQARQADLEAQLKSIGTFLWDA